MEKNEKGFSPQEDVDVFMMAAQQPMRYKIPNDPKIMFDEPQSKLYMDLIEEEFNETKEAFNNKDVVEVADGIADMVWVIMGLSSTLGIDFYKVWEAVYQSNMSKVQDGMLIKNPETGKVMKPETYFKPKIREALGLNGIEETSSN
jgi:predicted HAD superfamily Cof-like phosphohydrolase